MSAACIAACSAATIAASNAALMAASNTRRMAAVNSSRPRPAELCEFRRNEYISPPIPTSYEVEEHGSFWGNVLIGVLIGLVIIAGVGLVWVAIS